MCGACSAGRTNLCGRIAFGHLEPGLQSGFCEDTGGGWSHQVATLTPGIPGDSGSAFVSADGKAVGTLSTLGLAPLPLSNNIGDLAKELAYARANSGISGLRLALGTEPFTPVL